MHPPLRQRCRTMTRWSMRVLLKLVIDCDPDAAWRALHSPRAVAELYGPMVSMSPVVPSGLPTQWEEGDDVPVSLESGPMPLGRQLIHVSHRHVDEPGGAVRIFRDSGIPLTGPLWRDRLVFDGPGAVLLWPVLWAIWQWRGARIRALASSWAHDPAADTIDTADDLDLATDPTEGAGGD